MQRALAAISPTGRYKDGLRYVQSYHPHFYGQDNWPHLDSPRISAESVEARLRAAWEAAG